MFADDRLMAGQGHGGGLAIERQGVAVRCDSVSVEKAPSLPPPYPPYRGCTPQFFLHFSLDGVCLADGDTDRKRFKVPRTGW
jgi:hypothetical protein